MHNRGNEVIGDGRGTGGEVEEEEGCCFFGDDDSDTRLFVISHNLDVNCEGGGTVATI